MEIQEKKCSDSECPTFYVRGEIGIDDCPEGYFPINEPSTCVQASNTLGLDFSIDINTDIASGKCYWCEGCTPKGVRIDSAMGGEARLICQPRDHSYFEGEMGNKDCELQGGWNIMTKAECEVACGDLGRDFNPAHMRNNKICYMSMRKKCRQTGKPGSKSSLICRRLELKIMTEPHKIHYVTNELDLDSEDSKRRLDVSAMKKNEDNFQE